MIVRWHGTGASYFRSAQVDRTRRARPASGVTDGNPNKHTSSGPSARVRWDIRDGASVFNNDACYLHPAPKEGVGFDSIGVDDVDDGCVRPSRDEAPHSSISSPPVNHLPWEVRFAVCVSRPGSIYGTTERVLGEGVLNLAEFTDSVHGKRVSEKRVEVRMAMGGNGGERRRDRSFLGGVGGASVGERERDARAGPRVEGGGATRRQGTPREGQGGRRQALLLPLRLAIRSEQVDDDKSIERRLSPGAFLGGFKRERRRLQRRDGHVRERLHAVTSDDPNARSHRGANRRFWFNRGPERGGFFSRNRFARLQRQSKASLEELELEHEVDIPGTQAAAGRCR